MLVGLWLVLVRIEIEIAQRLSGGAEVALQREPVGGGNQQLHGGETLLTIDHLLVRDTAKGLVKFAKDNCAEEMVGEGG